MNVVFDFGGVVFHWRPLQMLQREVPHLAHDAASAALLQAQIFQAWGGDWAEFDRGTLGPAEVTERIARRTGLRAADVRHVVDAVPRELQPRPDTVALLHELHAAGCGLFFLSNMPSVYARHLLRQHDFLRLFKAGVFSADVGLIKPEPAIYALAQQRFGQAAQSLVFLDDHPPNVDAARAAGWQALQFSDAGQARVELAAIGALSLPQPAGGGSATASSPSDSQASSSV